LGPSPARTIGQDFGWPPVKLGFGMTGRFVGMTGYSLNEVVSGPVLNAPNFIHNDKLVIIL